MPNIAANGIQIEYETFGEKSATPLLLVMGLGAQMISWPEPFCELLAAHGHYVIRYDNRDTGLSTRFDAAGVPNIAQAMVDMQDGKPLTSAYDLGDMARDGIGLLDALGVARAHVVGASMGGMIVQMMAINHAHRLRSMTSIMSTTGEAELPGATPEAQTALLTPAPADREGYVANTVKNAHVMGNAPKYWDDQRRAEFAGRVYDRAFYPVGAARHIMAIAATGGRRERLRSTAVPTLVIHGETDALVNVAGGRDTAAAIPGASLLIFSDMGHDLPEPLWPTIAGAIAGHTKAN